CPHHEDRLRRVQENRAHATPPARGRRAPRPPPAGTALNEVPPPRHRRAVTCTPSGHPGSTYSAAGAARAALIEPRAPPAGQHTLASLPNQRRPDRPPGGLRNTETHPLRRGGGFRCAYGA